jgi:RHS repeat-associated protein
MIVLKEGTTTYLYGMGYIGQETGGEMTVALADRLGSVRQLITDGQDQTLLQSFDPFGNTFTSLGNGESGFGYTGEQTDGSGLVYLRARYYDPGTGRFITQDPFPGVLSLPATLNGYTYAVNNPISYTDPSGEIIPILLAAVGATVAGGVISGGLNLLSQCTGYSSIEECTKCADWAAVGAAAGAGALAGLLGFALAGLAIPTGVGLGLTIAGGALIGVVTGQAYRAVELALLGQQEQIPSELGHIDDMLIDGLIGGAGGAVGYGITKAFNSVFGCSFSEDTEVATSGGDKEISEVETGDRVLAYDQENESIGYFPVTATISEEHQVIINLVIDGEWIKTTTEHPFYTEELGWVKAGELMSGMHVMKSDLESGMVWLIWEARAPQSMYNLTIDTAHTYFVGDGQWLVHNTCPIPKNGETPYTIRGKAEHKLYPDRLGDDYLYSYRLPSGKKLDAIDAVHYIVRELKPDNLRALKLGMKQLFGYLDELMESDPGPWIGIIDNY